MQLWSHYDFCCCSRCHNRQCRYFILTPALLCDGDSFVCAAVSFFEVGGLHDGRKEVTFVSPAGQIYRSLRAARAAVLASADTLPAAA